tara:strand:+ start:9450 stop:9614 length:165 start_codon:yes stop_codon:yes gene_type:complete
MIIKGCNMKAIRNISIGLIASISVVLVLFLSDTDVGAECGNSSLTGILTPSACG